MKKCFAVFFLALLCSVGSFAQQKFALVIGNGNYTHVSRLNNPINDANDMEAALLRLGFTVDKVLNGTQEQMVNGIIQLKRRLSASRNSYGFLFYAGHGVQSNNENFLIPVDADIPSESFLRNRSVSIQEMLDELNAAGNEFNVVILDACRDNPFSWRRSGSRGLTVVGDQPADSILVFATAAGGAAADGEGRNGLFTSFFLTHLETPGLEIMEVIRRTGADVARASNNQQRPAVYNHFFGTVYLGVSSTPSSSPSPQTESTAALTQRVLAQSTPAPVQPVSTQIASLVAHPAPEGFAYIQGGVFAMGSPGNEVQRDTDEGPQRQVTVSSFYMGKYEVTQAEYESVMGGNPSIFKGPTLPVENLSWLDAVEYCNRRSQAEGLTPAYAIAGSGNSRTVTWNQSANGYRLPTEAEWEYACRAMTVSPFSTGNTITTGQANYDGNNPYSNQAPGEYRERTSPVGSFLPNPWGLYDMHGNVWEWCWDWYSPYPASAQTNPAGPSSGAYRVIRGGSWRDAAQYLRSAYRLYRTATNQTNGLGFRVVRR